MLLVMMNNRLPTLTFFSLQLYDMDSEFTCYMLIKYILTTIYTICMLEYVFPGFRCGGEKQSTVQSASTLQLSLSGYMQSQGVNDTDDQGPLQDPEHPNGSLPEFQFISVSAFALSTCNLQLLASRVFSHALQGKWN